MSGGEAWRRGRRAVDAAWHSSHRREQFAKARCPSRSDRSRVESRAEAGPGSWAFISDTTGGTKRGLRSKRGRAASARSKQA